MGFEKGFKALKMSAAAAAGILGVAAKDASAIPAPRLAPEHTQSRLVHDVGFIPEENPSDLMKLYNEALENVREYQRAKEGPLSKMEEDAYATKLFIAGNAVGRELRRYKEDNGGRTHPDLAQYQGFEEFEREALRDEVPDDEKLALFEKFFDKWIEQGLTIKESKNAVRGLYCGEFPTLCPPGN